MARNYENGYLPKIEYWTGKLKEAKEAGNVAGIMKAADKIAYFTTRQKVVYGGKSNVIAGVDFSDSLEALYHLGRS